MKILSNDVFQTIVKTWGTDKTIKVIFGAATGLIVSATVMILVIPNNPETINEKGE